MASTFDSRGAGTNTTRSGFKVVFGIDRVLPHAYFYVQHAYNAQLNEYYQKIPEKHRIYNSKTKRWSFQFQHYDEVLAKVLSLQAVDAQMLPAFVIEGIAAFTQCHDIGTLSAELQLDIPPLLKSALLPHQVEGVRYIIERRGRGMIADEMGCGKTLQAIALAYYYKESWPVLVIAPASVSAKWKAELMSWDPELTDDDVKILSKHVHQVTKFGIVNYDLMSKLTAKDMIHPGQFGVVIADESHYLKNREAMRTQCTVPFLIQAKIAICLSGTPALSCPVELYTQLNAMQPKIFSDYFGFTERYCNAHQSRFGRDVKGCSNADELKLLLESMIMIRRLKNEVLVHSLPKKVRDIVYVEPADIQMEEIRRIQDERRLVDMILRDQTLEHDVAERLKRDKQAMTTKLYRLTGLCKIDAIQHQIERLVQRANAGEFQSSMLVAAAAAGPDALVANNDETNAAENKNSLNDAEQPSVEAKCDNNTVEDGLVDSDEEEGTSNKRIKFTRPSSALSPRRERKRNMNDDANPGGGDGDDDDDLVFALTTKRWRRNEAKARGRKGLTQVENDGKDDNDDDNDDNDDDFIAVPKEDVSEDALQAWTSLLKGDGRKKRSRTGKKSKLEQKAPAKPVAKPVEPARKCDLKLVLFAHHKEVLDALEIRLMELNLSYVRIDGSTPVAARHAMICRFQDDDTTTVALLGMTACGTGVNFTRASIAIFAELYWTPGVLLQAEDRIHRIGQKANLVRILYVLARGTADDEMWSLAQNKLAVLESTLGELEQRPAGGKGMTVGTRQNARDRGQSSMFEYYSQGGDCVGGPTAQSHVSNEGLFSRESTQTTLFSYLSQDKAVKPTFNAFQSKPVQERAPSVKAISTAPMVATSSVVAAPAEPVSAAPSPTSAGSCELSPVTRARIEANRRRALEKRAQALQSRHITEFTAIATVAGGPLPVCPSAQAPTSIVSRAPPILDSAMVQVESNDQAPGLRVTSDVVHPWQLTADVPTRSSHGVVRSID